MCKAGLTASVCQQSAGQLKPGAKGLSLTPEQFASVRQAEPAISAALAAGDTSYELPLSDKCAPCCQTSGPRFRGSSAPASDVLWCISCWQPVSRAAICSFICCCRSNLLLVSFIHMTSSLDL